AANHFLDRNDHLVIEADLAEHAAALFKHSDDFQLLIADGEALAKRGFVEEEVLGDVAADHADVAVPVRLGFGEEAARGKVDSAGEEKLLVRADDGDRARGAVASPN